MSGTVRLTPPQRELLMRYSRAPDCCIAEASLNAPEKRMATRLEMRGWLVRLKLFRQRMSYEARRITPAGLAMLAETTP